MRFTQKLKNICSNTHKEINSVVVAELLENKMNDLPSIPTKTDIINIDFAFQNACREGNLNVVQMIYENLENYFNIRSNNDIALRDAIFYGHIAIIRYLLEIYKQKKFKPNLKTIHPIDDNYFGHQEITNLLKEYNFE